MNATLERRLAGIEAKLMPKPSPVKAMLMGMPGFKNLVTGHGLDYEQISKLPGACDGLPRDLLRALVERLKAEIAAR